MLRGTLAVVVLGLLVTRASADATDSKLYDRLWPKVPDAHRLTLSQQVQDEISEVFNTIGAHLDVLSSNMMSMKLDMRRRRAYVRLGGGDDEYMSFRLASDVLFEGSVAHVNTRVDLAFRGRKLQIELPDMDVVPASYNGERGVEVRLPLFRRRF